MGIRLYDRCYQIATVGVIGGWPFGAVIASALAVMGMMGLDRFLMLMPPSWYHSIFFTLFFLAVLVTYGAYRASLEYAPSHIILDKVVGSMIAFYGISFSPHRWKLLLVCFFLFHFLRFIKPLVLFNDTLKKIDALPGVLGIFASDIIFGLVVHVVIRIGLLL